MNRTVSIVILNWNGRSLLPACLSSLKKTVYPDYRLVLVDNGSRDDSVEFARNNFKEVEILELGKNHGYPKGCNEGIKYALEKHDPGFVLLLNNDTEIADPQWLERLVALSQRDSQIAIVGCKLVYPDGRIQYMGTKFTPYECGRSLLTFDRWTPPSVPYQVESMAGAVFLMKREIIEKIGLLDEGFFPFSCEDADYCMRVRKSGYQVWLDPSIKVIHAKSVSVDKIPTGLNYRTGVKNAVRFRLLNFSLLWLALALVSGSYNLMGAIFERKDKSIGLRPWNLRLRGGWKESLRCFIQAWIIIVRHLSEILKKRMNRSAKIWY